MQRISWRAKVKGKRPQANWPQYKIVEINQNQADEILGSCNQTQEIGASIFNWIDTW